MSCYEMRKNVAGHTRSSPTANEYFHLVIETWWSDVLFDQVGGNITDGPFQTGVSCRSIKDGVIPLTVPTWTCGTDGVDDVERLGVFLFEGVKLFL